MKILHPPFVLQVSIESDGDLHGALVSFLELACSSDNASLVPLQTIHIEECVQVMMQREDGHTEPLELHLQQSASKKRCVDGNGQSSKRPKKV